MRSDGVCERVWPRSLDLEEFSNSPEFFPNMIAVAVNNFEWGCWDSGSRGP